MRYRLFFYDFFGQIKGVKLIDAINSQTAIAIAIGLSKTARDQRTELWDGDRLVMRHSFPEPITAD